METAIIVEKEAIWQEIVGVNQETTIIIEAAGTTTVAITTRIITTTTLSEITTITKITIIIPLEIIITIIIIIITTITTTITRSEITPTSKSGRNPCIVITSHKTIR